MGVCVVEGCSNSSQKGFLMKCFPSDPGRRQEWIDSMHLGKCKIKDSSTICEVHFEAKMWGKGRSAGSRKLKPGAIPTILTSNLPPRKSKRSRINYEEKSSSSSGDDTESDSGDPSYIATISDEVSEEEMRGRRTRNTRLRSRSGTTKTSAANNSESEADSTNGPPPLNSMVCSNAKVYNPYSQQMKASQPSVMAVAGAATSNSNGHPIHPDVRLCRLPFFQRLAELLKPSMLKPQSISTMNEDHFFFYLTPQQTEDVIQSRTVKHDGICEYEKQVQLRFCLAETMSIQEDYFPPNLSVKINSHVFPLPSPLPTKPDMPPKRPAKPLNITPLTRLSAVSANTITVYWTQDQLSRGFVVCVELVHKLTAHDLLDRLKKKGIRHADHTRALIKEKLTEEDSEIQTTHLRVSLKCPLGKMRMTHPCRSLTCTHLQCFDSSLFLQMNERKSTWMCPVCDKFINYESIVIDGYFVEVLQSPQLPSEINEIELNKDGSWNIQSVSQAPAQCMGGSGASVTISAASLSATPSCQQMPPQVKSIEIIDDDDDDDTTTWPNYNNMFNVPTSSSSIVSRSANLISINNSGSGIAVGRSAGGMASTSHNIRLTTIDEIVISDSDSDDYTPTNQPVPVNILPNVRNRNVDINTAVITLDSSNGCTSSSFSTSSPSSPSSPSSVVSESNASRNVTATDHVSKRPRLMNERHVQNEVSSSDDVVLNLATHKTSQYQPENLSSLHTDL